MYRSKRRKSIPTIRVSGTYYDVGYDIGRTFASMIHKVISGHALLNDVYINYYKTVQGKNAYECCLETAYKSYPNYIRELQGTADGARVPFFKLFLLHLDDIFPYISKDEIFEFNSGCTSVIVENDNEKHSFIGHTVDAYKIFLNNMYILEAHITESYQQEEFIALCSAGLLPGSIIGYNTHGLVYTINTINVKCLNVNGIPRAIIARALLGADSIIKIKTIMRCRGFGLANALSLNFTFVRKHSKEPFYNIEASPEFPSTTESTINFTVVSKYFYHCNRFQRLTIPQNETATVASQKKEQTLKNATEPLNKNDLIKLLGDMSKSKCNIFTEFDEKEITTAVVIFDLGERIFNVYQDNPISTMPCITLPMSLKQIIVKNNSN